MCSVQCTRTIRYKFNLLLMFFFYFTGYENTFYCDSADSVFNVLLIYVEYRSGRT